MACGSMEIVVIVVGVELGVVWVKLAVQLYVVLPWWVELVQLVLPVWLTVVEPVVEDPVCATCMTWQVPAAHWVEVGKVEPVYIPLVTAVKVMVLVVPPEPPPSIYIPPPVGLKVQAVPTQVLGLYGMYTPVEAPVLG